jgi:hypothetical protein
MSCAKLEPTAYSLQPDRDDNSCDGGDEREELVSH